MSAIDLPNLDIGNGDFKSQESMDNILNVLQKYRKEINFMLLNLDARNMPSIITKIEQKEEAILKQDTPPEHLEGRLWLDTSVTPNKLKRSTGSAWVEAGADTSLLATKSEVSQTADSVVMSFSQLQNLYGEDVVISQGNTIISKDGIKVTHTGLGGQYSEMRADGFVRKWSFGEAKYLNDIYIFTNYATENERESPIPVTIPLPDRFKNRNFEAIVIPKGYRASGLVFVDPDNTVRYALDELELWTSSSVTTGLSPKVTITCYLCTSLEDEDDPDYRVRYRDVEFDMIIIGY